MADKKYTVQGTITDKEGKPAPGLLVQAFDEDPNTVRDLLGTVVSDDNGKYSIGYTGKQFRRPKESGGADIIIKVYDEKGKFLHETERYNNCGQRKTINITLENYPSEEETEKTQYVISGKVVTEKGEAIPGAIVEVFEQVVPGKAKAVVSAGYPVMSREDGYYEIQVPYEYKRGFEKRTPSFVIKVSDKSGKTVHTTTRYNAKERDEVHLIVPKKAYKGTSEFEKLNISIGKFLGDGVKIQDIREDKNVQGITYLSRKTTWDARLVAMGVLSHKYASKDIPADFYYTLFRAGVDSNKDSLFRIPADKAIELYEKAMKNNLVSEHDSDLAAIKEAFLAESKKHILQSGSPQSISTMDDMLSLSLKDSADDKLKFVELYFHGENDIHKIWENVEENFGPDVTKQLKLDGKLGFLTFNNAPLIAKLKDERSVVSDPVELIKSGYYKEEKWESIIDSSTAVPKVFKGKNKKEKRSNYIKWLSGQLKVSYPTAVVAEKVKEHKELQISNKEDIRNEIYDALYHQANGFEIGKYPINKHLEELEKAGVQLSEETKQGLKKLHRTHQLSPSDKAMSVLLDKGLDSAFKITRYERDDFAQRFKKDFGDDETEAQLVYDKAAMDTGLISNVIMSYMTQATNPLPAAVAPMITNSPAASVKKYPKIEDLFGTLDYCTCGHCESVLSPAAYLVDLLQFIDLSEKEHDGDNPIDTLVKRRPDIEHIQLTCENTNTVLPYIDLVNEILEYYVIHPDKAIPDSDIENSIEGFEGYNIEDGIGSEELLANPQYVSEKAYNKLQEIIYPFNLPFSRNLELLRAYFDHLDVPLHRSMEVFREGDKLSPTAPLYGWREILSEYLGFSPNEYAILTDHNFKDPDGNTYPIQSYYGLTDMAVLNDEIANAKEFSKRVNIKYAELIEILKTQFINPESKLLPKLEILQNAFNKAKEDDSAIQAAYGDKSVFEIVHDFFQGDTGIVADFNRIFPPNEYDLSIYGGDLKIWMRDVHDQVMSIIFLTPFDININCDFGNLELRYANPDAPELHEIEYWKLMRFIRLWKKLGWSIETTDKVIKALYNDTDYDFSNGSEEEKIGKLDDGFKDFLIKLAIFSKIRETLKIRRKENLERLLTLFAEIDTHGNSSLYRRMFLRSSILKIDDVFKEDCYGNYLADTSAKIFAHKTALQAAFNLTDDEWSLVVDDLSFDDTTQLTISNISKIYRFGFLARSLKISVSELIALKNLSGIDPFTSFTYEGGSGQFVESDLWQFIKAAKQIQQSDFKVQELKYLLQHIDETGQSGPEDNEVFALIKVINQGLKKIDEEYPVEGALTEETAQTLLATIYGDEVASTIYAILSETRVFSSDYDHESQDLEQAIKDTDSRLHYDDFEKTLSYNGVMTNNKQSELKDVSGVSQKFKDAIDDLYDQGQKEFELFFNEHPEIKVMYETHSSFEDVISTHLAPLIGRLKNVYITQTLSTSLGIDLSLLTPLLDQQLDEGDQQLDEGTHYIVHAHGQDDVPAIIDFLNLGGHGISAEYFYADDISGIANLHEAAIENISFDRNNNLLPPNPTIGSTISAKWTFFLEAPASEYYNFYLETDPGAGVKLFIDGIEKPMQNTSDTWSNQKAVKLEMGQFYDFEVQVVNVKDKAILKWQSKGEFIDYIPTRNVYPSVYVEHYRPTYLRILKSLRIIEGLSLSPEELEYFSNNHDFKISNVAFLNHIPISAGILQSTVRDLFKRITQLIEYNGLKEQLEIDDNSLVKLLKTPTAQDEDGKFLLFKVPNWNESDLIALIQRFTGNNATDLTTLLQQLTDDRELLDRLIHAFEMIKKTGLAASELMLWTSPSPVTATLSSLQNALRAKYDEAAWLDVIQPINDTMRSRQRNALVSYILNTLQQDPQTEHIDTPDKLFEFFLIDVEMEPCMKTSRIKQAISTVQLFIYRCLMNLEAGVEPSSINAAQWEWMKRYRVWEANRKVFLYPENWLEPSLRDTKSPLFKEFEGELLQSDINDDLATSALLNYLEKLDKIAQLEICGMCRENEETIHVVGRTAGANREYYHRIYDGTWSAWEKINLDIEDGSVIPVFWKDRLFVFWISIVQKGQDENQLSSDQGAGNLTAFNKPIKRQIEINLCWSEYYNNKWQAKRTSDFDNPVSFGLEGELYKNDIPLYSLVLDGMLKIATSNKEKNYGGVYTLYNKHSLPDKKDVSWNIPWNIPAWKTLSNNSIRSLPQNINSLTVNYDTRSKNFSHKVLDEEFYRKIDFPYPITNIFEEPFFCQDHQHTFFVSLVKSSIRIPRYEYLGPEIVVRIPEFVFDDIWVKPDVIDPGYIDPGFIDPIPFEVLTLSEVADPAPVTEVGVSRMLNRPGLFDFEGNTIGVQGGAIS